MSSRRLAEPELGEGRSHRIHPVHLEDQDGPARSRWGSRPRAERGGPAQLSAVSFLNVRSPGTCHAAAALGAPAAQGEGGRAAVVLHGPARGCTDSRSLPRGRPQGPWCPGQPSTSALPTAGEAAC